MKLIRTRPLMWLAAIVALFASLLAAPAQAATPTPVSANVNIMSATANALSQSASAALEVVAEERSASELVVLDQRRLDDLEVGTTYRVSLDGRAVLAELTRKTCYSNVKGHPGTPVCTGYWLYGGKLYICTQYILHQPDGTSTTVRKVKGEKNKQLAVVANDVKASHNAFQAECHSWAGWLIVGSKAAKIGYGYLKKSGRLTKGVAGCVGSLMQRARLHGPYTVTVNYDKPKFGRKGTATFTYKASNGRPAARKLFDAKAITDNLRVVSAPKRLNAKGKAVVTYRVTKLDTERPALRGCAREASSYKALFTNPSAGRQKLEGGGFSEQKCKTFRWKAGIDVKSKPECPDDCFGIGQSVNTVCAPAGTPVRVFNEGSNGVNRHFDTRQGTCGSKTWKFPDATDVTVYVCALDKVGGHCVSDKIKTKVLHIVCPAWPTVGVCTEEGCEQGKVVRLYGFAPTDSPRFYEAWWVLPDGKRVVKALPRDASVVNVDVDAVVEVGDAVRKGFTVYSDGARTQKIDSNEMHSVVIGDN